MPRGADAARAVRRRCELDLGDGERVHVYGRPELYEQRGDFHLRALTIERYGLGAHLAALERLKQKLAAEGLFAAERKRPLPRIPRLIGLVTGNDAAAKRDVLTAITTRFPPAHVLVAETLVQGPRAGAGDRGRDRRPLRARRRRGVLARGGGSFEDLLPFSDERLVRAVAACPVPVVSRRRPRAGHAALDLAADVRASTPTVAGRLVVPDLAELARLARPCPRRRSSAARAASSSGTAQRLGASHERLRRAPLLALERRRPRLETAHGRLRALSPAGDARARLRDRPRGEALVREPPRAGTGARRRGRRRRRSERAVEMTASRPSRRRRPSSSGSSSGSSAATSSSRS